ncbi:hypothetical protein WA026_015054 [Henosepilachna vigintioctopunctata]|uniref:Uncharacterized protein n=1 Tax=Henosepilachna vigintioctopunctata TaxID=420089 RepID=A0AAW1U828_9CUCU
MQPNERPRRCSRCRCGKDFYRQLFGPTPDETLLILLATFMEFLLRWKDTFDEPVDSEEDDQNTQGEIDMNHDQPIRKRRPYGGSVQLRKN